MFVKSLFVSLAVIMVVAALVLRADDLTSAELVSTKFDMFSDLQSLPKEKCVSLALLNLPSGTSNPDFISAVETSVNEANSKASSPRDRALTFLKANPLTPNCLLRLRLKEIELTCHTIHSHDPSFGSHWNPIEFEFADLL